MSRKQELEHAFEQFWGSDLLDDLPDWILSELSEKMDFRPMVMADNFPDMSYGDARELCAWLHDEYGTEEKATEEIKSFLEQERTPMMTNDVAGMLSGIIGGKNFSDFDPDEPVSEPPKFEENVAVIERE